MSAFSPARLSQRLSREGRDTLWLLAVLALSMLPHAARLPLWCMLGTGTAMLWRAQLAWRDAPLPPRWVLLACLVACVALTLGTYHSLMGREAGVTMVTLLAGLKTLELRARRDAFVITSLGFFLILTQFLYSQSPGMALLMATVLLGLLSSLVLAQRPLGRPSIASAVKAAARVVGWGLPVMLALYLLFPRLGPLWALPSDAANARTGLSDQLTLGRVAQLALDDSIAMRLQFNGPAPPPEQLYFRGPVLDTFDGQQWRPHPRSPGEAPQDDGPLEVKGPLVSYQVTLEPNGFGTLPLLEGTLQASLANGGTGLSLQREGIDWRANHALNERTQVNAQAALGVRHGPLLDDPSLREWVQLPPGHNPRTLGWALAFRSQAALREAEPKVLAQAVMRHIRQTAFRYTLSPDDTALDAQGQPERHQIDRFWLDRRSGFCEHFATAFVVVMRAMDVPARVVTGFQGAEINPVDGLYVVRNSDAHAWAEYWQAGEGWVRADPTAAVAPERVDRARPRLRNPEGAAGQLDQLAPAWLTRARAAIDAGNHRWNVWVLAYSRNSQMDLLRNWGWDAPDGMALVRLCITVIVSLSLAGVVWLWWQRPRTRRSAWQGAMQRVHRALSQAGVPTPTDSPEPAAALAWVRQLQGLPTAAQASAGQAELTQALIASLQTLDALRYSPQASTAERLPPDATALVRRIGKLAQQWRQGRALPPERLRAST